MMPRILFAGCAVLAIAAAAPLAAKPTPAAPAVGAPAIAYSEWTLDNGLKVIAIPDNSTASVLVSMWYNVGSKHDPDGRSGFAHLFEHILSRKTVNMPYNMINRLTDDVGGVRNASTSDDRTNYYETVPAQYLETMLWTHAERMARPVVDSEVFERERSIVKEELRQRVLAPPYGRLFAFALPEASYSQMPQRRPTIGSIEQLDAAKLDDARAFHQAYYGPDSATLIVSGNFDTPKLRALVDRYFAPIPRRAKPISLAIATREPARAAPRRVDAVAPGVPLPMVAASWTVPGATSRDAAALELLGAVLMRGENSRLNTALVRSGKAGQVIDGSSLSREIGLLVPIAAVSAGQSSDEVAGLLAAEVEAVRTNGVSEAEVSEARNELFAASLRQRETATGRGFELGEALVLTGDPAAADKRLAALAKVTPADVQRVARRYLAPRAMVDIRYGQGPDNAASWANPVPMPRYATVPAATGSPLVLRDEAAREAPPAPGAAPAIIAPTIAETRLGNGLGVVTARTGTTPIATLTVLLPGGAITEARDKAGLSQFVATIAAKGTATRSAAQIAAQLESLGATITANAGAEGTQLAISAPTANLAAAGEILADVVRNASFPAEEFELERRRALDGLTIKLKDPGALAPMVLQPLLYGDAPYGTLGSGTTASLARLSRDDLVTYARQWWHPAASRVLVAGGIDNAEATALVERLFGSWQGTGAAPVAPASRAGTAPVPRTVVVDMPEAGQAAVFAAVRGVGRGEAGYYPLLLANSVLGMGSNGRLFEEVRTKRGLSYGAYSTLAARAEAGLLTASAQTKNESAADVVKVFLDQFARLGREPIAPEALAKRRLFLGGANQRALETSAGFSATVATLLQQGLSPTEALQFAHRLAGVTPEEVSAAAARYAAPEQVSLVVVGNAAQFLDKLKALRGEVTVIKATDLDLSRADLGAR